MKNRNGLVATLLFILVVGLGCGLLSKLNRDRIGSDSARKSYSAITRSELQKAQKEFENALGKESEIETIVLFNTYISISVTNRQNRRKSDEYFFDMKGVRKHYLKGLSSNTLPGRYSFALSDIKFIDALEIIKKAKASLNIPDAEVKGILITRRGPSHRQSFDESGAVTRWRVILLNRDKEHRVTFDNKTGKQIENPRY